MSAGHGHLGRQGPGFSVVELVVVVAILALFLAVVLALCKRARESSRVAVCQGNLRQLGQAVQMASSDNEGRPPYAVDPSDKALLANWADHPEFMSRIPEMPTVMEALTPYVHDRRVWHCPSDSGFDVHDSTDNPLPAHPTSYEALDTSYFYRTELALVNKPWSSIRHLSEVNVLFDAWGGWHGPSAPAERRKYNVLYGDGHVKTVRRPALVEADHTPLF